jgi:hypothetical protein
MLVGLTPGTPTPLTGRKMFFTGDGDISVTHTQPG